MRVAVKSTSIDWVAGTLTITDIVGGKHVLPLDREIHVTMVGYPAREHRSMQAAVLGKYMERGYIIEQIEFEEGGQEA